jgi:phage recombination protein Bet
LKDLVEFTEGQIALVKRQICKPKNREATQDELALFVGQCKRTGLDPFAKQIYAVFRKDRNGREQMGIQVSIDGQRVVAERTGQYAGQEGPFWCGQDGEWLDIWLEPNAPSAAKVVVLKVMGTNLVRTNAIALWNEYAVFYGQNLAPMWKDKPALMLAKCAEALALRKAFPNDLSGLYVAEEMGRADASAPSFDARAEVLEEAPALPSGNGDDPGKEVIDVALADTGLNDRVVGILANAGIERLAQLRVLSWDELMGFHNFGDRSRAEVQKLAEFYEFTIPNEPTHTPETDEDLEELVRAAWTMAGADPDEIEAKIRNAQGNRRVLGLLVEAANARATR